MTHYELMIMVNPLISTEEYHAIQKKYIHFIEENKGKIIESKSWGLRSLAYPVQKKTTAWYFILEYATNESINEKLIVQIARDEQVMRKMITVLDKHAVAYFEKKRNASKTA